MAIEVTFVYRRVTSWCKEEEREKKKGEEGKEKKEKKNRAQPISCWGLGAHHPLSECQRGKETPLLRLVYLHD